MAPPPPQHGDMSAAWWWPRRPTSAAKAVVRFMLVPLKTPSSTQRAPAPAPWRCRPKNCGEVAARKRDPARLRYAVRPAGPEVPAWCTTPAYIPLGKDPLVIDPLVIDRLGAQRRGKAAGRGGGCKQRDCEMSVFFARGRVMQPLGLLEGQCWVRTAIVQESSRPTTRRLQAKRSRLLGFAGRGGGIRRLAG